jgi:4-amino-4-deoxy-L-arabinose transferase-like glycosyltransferase
MKRDGAERILLIVLGCIALAATVINVVQLAPLFGTFFIHDDFEILRQGPHLRSDVSYIFTWHYKSFWRPLGFGLTGIVYLFAGFNTVPYHVLGYLVHLATALAVLLLGKKLFDIRVGLVAYIFYILSPVSFCAPGFVSSTFQDELAAGLLALTLALVIRPAAEGERRPYWGGAIAFLAAALCKESWVFFYPALLAADWANYPRSTLWSRIHRLLPLLAVLVMLPLRIAVVGYAPIAEVAAYDMSCFLNLQNLWLGLGQTFLPLEITVAQGWEYSVQIVLTVGFLVTPWLVIKEKRKLVAIYVALLFLWFITTVSAQMNGFRGWIHLQTVAAFASVIVAVAVARLLALRSKLVGCGVAGALIVGLNLWGNGQTANLVQITEEKSDYYRVTFTSFREQISRLPAGAHIYMLGGLAPELVQDALLPSGMNYTQVLFRRPDEPQIAECGTIAGTPAFLQNELAGVIGREETHILQRMPGGECIDSTEAIRTAIYEGKPLPIYMGKE